MGAEPCTPEHRALPHALSCQTEGSERRNTSRKISTGFVICGDLCGAPRLPVTTHSPGFLSSSLSFLRTFYSSASFSRAFLAHLRHTCASSTCTLHPWAKPGAWLLTPSTRANNDNDTWKLRAVSWQNLPRFIVMKTLALPPSVGNFLCLCNYAFLKMV